MGVQIIISRQSCEILFHYYSSRNILIELLIVMEAQRSRNMAMLTFQQRPYQVSLSHHVHADNKMRIQKGIMLAMYCQEIQCLMEGNKADDVITG